MATEDNKTTPRPCPEDCSKCSLGQQVYCVTKMVYQLSQRFDNLEARINDSLNNILELLEHVDLPNELSKPMVLGEDGIAQ